MTLKIQCCYSTRGPQSTLCSPPPLYRPSSSDSLSSITPITSPTPDSPSHPKFSQEYPLSSYTFTLSTMRSHSPHNFFVVAPRFLDSAWFPSFLCSKARYNYLSLSIKIAECYFNDLHTCTATAEILMLLSWETSSHRWVPFHLPCVICRCGSHYHRHKGVKGFWTQDPVLMVPLSAPSAIKLHHHHQVFSLSEADPDNLKLSDLKVCGTKSLISNRFTEK